MWTNRPQSLAAVPARPAFVRPRTLVTVGRPMPLGLKVVYAFEPGTRVVPPPPRMVRVRPNVLCPSCMALG